MTDEHDAHLLSGAYALDALTDEERAAVEAAIADSEELQHEVVGLVDTAVALGLSVPPVDPPAALRSRILAGIEDLPQLPAEPSPVEHAPAAAAVVREIPQGRHRVPRRRRRVRVAGVLMASLGVAALLFGGGIALQGLVQGPQTQFSQIEAASDVHRASEPVTGGGTAEISWSRSQGRTAVVLNGVRVPQGRVLQLWNIQGDTITSRGLYQPAGDQDFVTVDGVPASGSEFAVSVEPPGGSAQPTTHPIVRVPVSA